MWRTETEVRAMTVLLLNASFEPLRVITTRRALGLVLSGKADLVVPDGDEQIRSAGGARFAVPAVVRLRRMVRVPFQATAPLSRRAIQARDGRSCQVVGCARVGQTIDHIVPRSRGGRHEWTNVTLMCVRHNSQKGDRLLHEMGWKLKAEPTAPRGALVLLARAGLDAPPPLWAPFLPAI
jgi:5-methylcytosine-specific restriction endonuclease McrA